MTPSERDQLRQHLREAISAQAKRWDAERAIENIFGVELDTEDMIKDAAVFVDGPDHVVSDDLVNEVCAQLVLQVNATRRLFTEVKDTLQEP